MDVVRFLAGLFFAIWSIVGIVAFIGGIIGMIAMAGFATKASSFMGNMSALGEGMNKENQGMYPSDGMNQIQDSQEVNCAIKVLGKERVQQITQGQKPTPEEESKIRSQCG